MSEENQAEVLVVTDRRAASQPKEEALAVVEPTPASLLQKAIEQNLDLEKLEKLLELQRRWDEMRARQEYTKAMAAFKQNQPSILKDKKVDFKTKSGDRIRYNHASLGNITKITATELGKHGLSAAWKTEQGKEGITVTCVITHSNGHFESTSLTATPDQTGKKNDIQAVGSTITYLQRYTLLAILGLATADQDNDGRLNTSHPPPDGSGQQEQAKGDKTEHPPPSRAYKAAERFKQWGILIPELEQYLGRKAEKGSSIEIDKWSDREFKFLTELRDILKNTPQDEIKNQIRALFELEPGSEG